MSPTAIRALVLALTYIAGMAPTLAAGPGPIKRAREAGAGQIARARAVLSEKPPFVIRDKWAVLVGVSRYNDPSISASASAARNVLTLTKTLIDPECGRFAPDHVLVVTDGHATKESLARATYQDWLIKKALPSHLILIYLALKLTASDDGTDLLLLPADASLKDKELTSVSLSGMLQEIKRRTQSKNIVLLLDATTVDGKSAAAQLAAIARQTGITLLSADAGLAASANDDFSKNSLFALYLSEGIKTGAGQMPIESIAGYISEVIAKAPPAQKLLQKPLYLAGEEAELVKQPLGLKIKLPFDPKNVKVGHPLDTLAEKRPDLAAGLSPTFKAPLEDKRKAQTLQDLDRKKEEAEAADDDDDAGAEQVDFEGYMKDMKKAIQAKWQPPKGIAQKTIVAVFSIQRNGNIVEADIVESSGDAGIDQAAMKALKDASPLAPLPKGAPAHVQVRYKFDWKVSQ
ncbi:MAG: TonB family protein [Candidatus Melainabacteria bacterium]|nr:TonB family protein [Candidatus Melainabacteria bacterium]